MKGFWSTVYTCWKETRWQEGKFLAIVWQAQWIIVGFYAMFTEVLRPSGNWRHFAAIAVCWLMVFVGSLAYGYCKKRERV